MQSDSEIIRKAKKCLRKQRLINISFWFLILVADAFACVFCHPALFFPIFLLSLLIYRKIGSFTFKKYIYSSINDKLDADLFHAISSLAKFNDPSSTLQICDEYFCGNYQKVVSLCKTQLGNPKLAKRFNYNYLVLLANVYFDVDDVDNLRSVHNRFEDALSKERPKKMARIRAAFPRMKFYESYLNQDYEACMDFADKPANTAIRKISNLFYKARLNFINGNHEESDRLYEAVAREAPSTNYGKITSSKLRERGKEEFKDYSQNFKLTSETTEVKLYYRKSRVIATLIVDMISIVLVFLSVSSLHSHIQKKEYYESIQVLVEEDYKNVEVLEAFSLYNAQKHVDDMFICKTDRYIIVGALYVYEGESTLYYDKLAAIPLSSLSKNSSPIETCRFESVITDNYVKSAFYTVKDDVPDNCLYRCSFTVNGKEVYFVVTEIMPIE